jgi:hypothetical protein
VNRTKSTVFALATSVALALTLGIAPAFAQGQAPPPSPAPQVQAPPPSAAPQAQPERAQPAKDPAPVSGDLVSVDSTAKSITVKLANGNEEKFTYNDTTEITGAKDGAAGLATMKEGRVTVHFKEDAATRSKLATRIIVQPARQ